TPLDREWLIMVTCTSPFINNVPSISNLQNSNDNILSKFKKLHKSMLRQVQSDIIYLIIILLILICFIKKGADVGKGRQSLIIMFLDSGSLLEFISSYAYSSMNAFHENNKPNITMQKKEMNPNHVQIWKKAHVA
ncbi:hypothetical protein ACJX0J_031248, partial [Zea mays]